MGTHVVEQGAIDAADPHLDLGQILALEVGGENGAGRLQVGRLRAAAHQAEGAGTVCGFQKQVTGPDHGLDGLVGQPAVPMVLRHVERRQQQRFAGRVARRQLGQTRDDVRWERGAQAVVPPGLAL